MPLPVSHCIDGAAVYVALDEDGGGSAWPRLVAAMLIANAPDVDLIPGMLIGDPNRFHHGATHSLVTAVAVGLVAALALGERRAWPVGWATRAGGLARPAVGTLLVVALCWGSHVVLDSLTHDPSPPVGVPMFWPLTSDRVNLAPLFPRGDKLAGEASAGQFLGSIVSAHNARAAAFEALLMGPIPLGLWWLRRHRRRGRADRGIS